MRGISKCTLKSLSFSLPWTISDGVLLNLSKSARTLRSFEFTADNEDEDITITNRVIASLSQVESLSKLSLSLNCSRMTRLHELSNVQMTLKVLKLNIKYDSERHLTRMLEFISRCSSLNRLEFLLIVPPKFESSSIHLRCPQSVEHLALDLKYEIGYNHHERFIMALSQFFTKLTKLKSVLIDYTFEDDSSSYLNFGILPFSPTLQVLSLIHI
eukprot:TRINITY_DN4470_c0_g1_i1.p1 TRINITY_DN4470_c0_g1~~TRINITY_DN4470_c0_g1_i1.p1  ORF type:complete len:214 (-),score=12.63 TRINITY_DN4470_c0_g1_i1:3-644(-)